MLDLKAGIDLEKPCLVPHGVQDELDRPRRKVIDRGAKPDRRIVQTRAQRFGQARCGGFLDDLLVTALQRTIAFAKRHDAARPVAEDLHLDMTGARDEAFQVKPRIPEAGLGAAAHGGEGRAQHRRVVAELHADAAPARGAFQHDRIADARGLGQSLVLGGQQARARQKRHPRRLRQRAGAMLQAEGAQMVGSRADEGDALGRQPFRESGVLGQEAVAGMDGIRPRLARHRDHGVDIQIAFGGGRGAKPARLVGLRDMGRETVGIRPDRDRAHAHAAKRADDAQRDLAAIGDQNLAEHGVSPGSGRGSASGRSRCRDCSPADSSRSRRAHPSPPAIPHGRRAPRYRHRSSWRRSG